MRCAEMGRCGREVHRVRAARQAVPVGKCWLGLMGTAAPISAGGFRRAHSGDLIFERADRVIQFDGCIVDAPSPRANFRELAAVRAALPFLAWHGPPHRRRRPQPSWSSGHAI